MVNRFSEETGGIYFLNPDSERPSKKYNYYW